MNTPSAEPAITFSHSPPSNALSPRSEVSPSPSNWTLAQEQLAQEEYDNELAEHYLYELVRRFARATRALSHYDCLTCLKELEDLPHAHQHSPMVIALVGRAHYERQDYPSVRCFNITAVATWFLLISDALDASSGSPGIQSTTEGGSLSSVGYGGLLIPSVATAAECRAFVSGTRAA